jgi:hypothetical protein
VSQAHRIGEAAMRWVAKAVYAPVSMTDLKVSVTASIERQKRRQVRNKQLQKTSSRACPQLTFHFF